MPLAFGGTGDAKAGRSTGTALRCRPPDSRTAAWRSRCTRRSG